MNGSSVEELLSEAYDDPFFHDKWIEPEAASEGVCSIKGRPYTWRMRIDEELRIRIDYGSGEESRDNCLIDDVDAPLIDYLRKMASSVKAIRDVQEWPRSPYRWGVNNGWVRR